MSSARKAVVVALVANVAIAVAKSAAALVTRSSAMLAEAYHSVSDALNQVFLLVGLHRSKKPADERHPFGSGKSAYFWSFVVAVFIFGIAGTLSVVEGIDGLRHPEVPHREDMVWAWGTLAFAFAFEAYALAVTVKAFRRVSDGRGLASTVRHTKDATLLTVLFEDALALVGLVVAAAGLGLSLALGDGRFDAAASLVIGILLMGFALVLANRNRQLLIGEAVLPDEARAIDATVLADPAVRSIVSLKTMHLKADEVLVVIDVAFAPGLATADLERSIDRIEEAIRNIVPAAKHVYIEVERTTEGQG